MKLCRYGGKVAAEFLSFVLYILLTLSHLSTHFAWNSCEQGSTRSTCLNSKSHMQTTQDV